MECCIFVVTQVSGHRLTRWRNSAYKALIIVEIILPDGWVVRRQAGYRVSGVYCIVILPTLSLYSLHTTHLEVRSRRSHLTKYTNIVRALHCLPPGITRGSGFPVWTFGNDTRDETGAASRGEEGQLDIIGHLGIGVWSWALTTELSGWGRQISTQTFMGSYKNKPNSFNGLITNWE